MCRATSDAPGGAERREPAPSFARIGRRVTAVAPEFQIGTVDTEEGQNAQQRGERAEQEDVAVVVAEHVERLAEHRGEHDVGDRQEHRDCRVELREQTFRKEPLSQRRRQREVAAGDDAVDHQNHGKGFGTGDDEPARRHREQVAMSATRLVRSGWNRSASMPRK